MPVAVPDLGMKGFYIISSAAALVLEGSFELAKSIYF